MTETPLPSADRTPVIVGVGELADRPLRLEEAREPATLMVAALRLAQADAGAPLLAALDRLDIINEISWPYPDPCGLVTGLLGRPGLEATYHPVGGQTPMLALHEAALRIQAGRSSVEAVCGAEAHRSVADLAKASVAPNWSPRADIRSVRGGDHQTDVARRLDFAIPTHVYPFYEAGTRAAWGQSFDEAQAETGVIWSANAAVAQGREAAWIRREVTPEEVREPSAANRPLAWPYTKLMVANPMVNQGAAVIVCSVAKAIALGVPEARWVHIWGGSAANETRDVLARDGYARSQAMEAVLQDTRALLEANGRARFDHLELYSCFPCVPKMARRVLGVAADAPLSVAGGLTFFGAPLNDYMTHAAVAMVQRLRAEPGAVGLLYGQGEYVTKHHALVLGGSAPRTPPTAEYRRTDVETALARQAPVLLDVYEGAADIETCTVLFDREARVRHGGVIARTPQGARLLTRVPAADAAAIACLMGEGGREPVGRRGAVVMADDGVGEWRPA